MTPVTAAVQPVLSPKNFMMEQYNRLERELRSYMKGKLQYDVINALYATVDGWNMKPRFVATFTEPYGRSQFWLTVKPAGSGTLNWVRVSRGTRSRSIYAKDKPMRFQEGYIPKTTAGGQYGGPGRQYGAWRKTWQVNNHSIEPRHFEEKVIEKFESPFTKEVNRIVRKVY